MSDRVGLVDASRQLLERWPGARLHQARHTVQVAGFSHEARA